MKKLIILSIILSKFSGMLCKTVQELSKPKIPNQSYFGYDSQPKAYNPVMIAYMCSPDDGPGLPYKCPDNNSECVEYKSLGGVTKGRSIGLCQPKLATIIKEMAK